MAKKFSRNEWIQKAKLIWKNTYDYRKVKYTNSKTKVQLICKINKHGSFWTLPSNHTGKKYGCPKCGKLKNINSLTKPFQIFKKQAQEIHNKKYTYDKESYKSAKIKTKITCKKHGIFWQTPDAHINGKQECKKCGEENYSYRNKLNTINNINILLKKKYKSSIALEENTYLGMHKLATFKCKKHGSFKRDVSSVIYTKKHPCKKCGLYLGHVYFRDNSLIEEIVNRQFGKKYKTLPFKIENKKTNLSFECKKHGIFSVTIGSLRNAKGCPKCLHNLSQNARTEGLRKKILSTVSVRFKNWLKKARLNHGNYYDYSKTKFITSTKSVKIICPKHGIFSQIPHTHLTAGCRKCADEELLGKYSFLYFKNNPKKKRVPATLYYLKLSYNKKIFYKIGITTTTIEDRFSLLSKAKIKITKLKLTNSNLFNIYKKEDFLIKSHVKKFNFLPKIKNFTNRELRLGQSECFSKPISKYLLKTIFDT